MSKYNIDMLYSINVSVEVEADSQEEAIEKAKSMVEEDKYSYIDLNEVSFDYVTFVSK